MILLLFVFGLSLVFGFYFLAAGVLRLPSMGAARAIADVGSGNRKLPDSWRTGWTICRSF